MESDRFLSLNDNISSNILLEDISKLLECRKIIDDFLIKKDFMIESNIYENELLNIKLKFKEMGFSPEIDDSSDEIKIFNAFKNS